MTIDQLITELQALPAEQRKLEVYVHAVNQFVPLSLPVAEEREITDVSSVTWSGVPLTYEKQVEFFQSLPQKKVMVII